MSHHYIYSWHKTNFDEGRLGIDSDNYGVFFWWPHSYFYSYIKCPGGLTEEEYLNGIHEF